MNIKLILTSLFLIISLNFGQETSVLSEESEACIDCHITVSPGIVEDWKDSRHSKITITAAFQKDELERRISIQDLNSVGDSKIVVGCYECHGLNTDRHKDSFEHFDYQINVVVSPNDCGSCHPIEVEEYLPSKKAHAYGNLKKNAVYNSLVETVIGMKELSDGHIKFLPSSGITQQETCFACHGSEIKAEGTKLIESDLGEIEVPNLLNWPNQGVGRINPDGSKGSCTSCHPRHSFSIETARKPYTCGQCHLEPDVPAYNVYKESKHGNIFESQKEKWDFENVPWQIGKDFKSPTCATCHNSLITDSEGEVIAERSHNFASKLWVRIFGLIYSHPQPKTGKTYEIKNKDGLPLPTTFSGEIADEYLLTKEEQLEKQSKMGAVCKSCHGTSWTEKQFAKLETVNAETDRMVENSTTLISEAWEKGLADKTNPFDEEIEMLWVKQWLFYANSIRYGTAMMGPDYSTFKNGWLNMTKGLVKMHKCIKDYK